MNHKKSKEILNILEMLNIRPSILLYSKLPKLDDSDLGLIKEIIRTGASPSCILFLIRQYLKNNINHLEFERMCKNSIYILDETYIFDKFKINIIPEEQPKVYSYPSAFYGACFGDIAGSAYEFIIDDDLRKKLNIDNCIADTSMFTDDSILSCATAISLKEKIQYRKTFLNLDDFKKENTYPYVYNPFVENYSKYTRNYSSYGFGPKFYEWALYNRKTPVGSFGNGAAMRISPIIDYCKTEKDVIFISLASAAATHNHPEGIKGAVVTAMCGFMAKQGFSKLQIFDYMKKYYSLDLMNQFSDIPLELFCYQALEKTIGQPVCQYSVPAAIICFYESNSFDEVINNVLKLNGDTDTIGAIAGSIAGAYYGVPEKYRKEVENKQPDNIFNTALKSLLS